MSHEQRLAEIAARLHAATPGPWRWRENYLEVEGSYGDPKRDWTVIADDGSAGGEYSQTLVPESPNGQFIAHAPEDIAFLLDLVRGGSSGEGREPE